MVLNVHRNRTAYQGRGDGGKGGMEVPGGEGGYAPIATLLPPEWLKFCIKVGSDESHFNVSVGSDEKTHNLLKENESRSGIEPRSFRLPA